MLPKRLPKKPRREQRLRSPAHRAWVRSHACCVRGCVGLPIEAAHVRSGTDGGTGLKPGDEWVISLCSLHHASQHALGEPSFETLHRIDLKKLAQEFAAASPALRRLKARAA